MASLLDLFSHPVTLVSIVLFIVYRLYSYSTSKPLIPKDLPWISKDESTWFAETRAHFASINNVQQWLREGYRKYLLNGKSYILPDFSGIPEIVIPPSQTQWLLEQPEDVLSVHMLHYDILCGRYAFTDPRMLKFPFHEEVVHRYLPRRLGGMIPDIWDEIKQSIDDTWGSNTSGWKEINIWGSMMSLIARVSNRAFVGLPMCRNEDYLYNMSRFAEDVFRTTLLLRFTPSFLHPIAGPLMTIPNNLHFKRSSKHTLPVIKQRLAEIAAGEKVPDDYITWHIELAQARGLDIELDPMTIARRLMPLNFAAIHTTTTTITNTFLDLFSSPSAEKYVPEIREEAIRVYSSLPNGEWDKASLALMLKTDSALRESIRVSNFLARGVGRKVVSPNGIVNPKEGWKAPFGACISLDVESVHHDPEIYQQPDMYDAFRFSRVREDDEKGSAEESKADVLEKKKLGMSTTSPAFLQFGHGRHACPGRFLVSHELKMLLAYVTMNYEVEPLSERPKPMWFGPNILPTQKATVRVRRRKST